MTHPSVGHETTPAIAPPHHQLGQVSLGPVISYLDGAHPAEEGIDQRYVDALYADMNSRREAILALPTQTDGINMQRLNGRLHSIGAPHKSILMLSPANFVQAHSLATEGSYEERDGAYLPFQDLTIVQRDPEMEALNGSEFIESVGYHEGVHGWTIPEVTVSATESKKGVLRRTLSVRVVPGLRRSGYIRWGEGETTKGLLIEEAHAEYERGLYVVNDLGRPDGFAGKVQHGPLALINKYMFLERTEEGESQPGMMEGATGAVMLELLIARDPEILQLLRGGRTSPTDEQQLKAHINAVVPGLYDRMDEVDIQDSEGQRAAARLLGELIKLFHKS